MGLEIRAFGPMEVVHDGGRVRVASRLQRVLLALLLVRRHQVVPAQTLVESMWPGGPPSAAARNLRFHVHRLRRVLGDVAALQYLPPGYALAVAEADVDLYRFEALVRRGRVAAGGGDDRGAAALLREATDLCRGPAFPGLEDLTEVAVEAQRLDELRLAALEERVAAELALGEHPALISELTALVATYPLRERFRAQLMIALYRGGRPADALATYRDGRRILVNELGIEPNEECQALERAILTDDPSLRPSEPAAGATPGAAAAPAGTPVPRQLPPDVPAFTGRVSELAWLDALLPEPWPRNRPVGIAVVEGTAGVGKTALATHWAHRARHRFPDGQLFADLRGHATRPPLSPAAVLAQFLRALGVPSDQVPGEVDEAASRYRSLLADRSVLVVLDNAMDPAQVRPLLPGSDRCAVVVTSRGRLSGLVARDGARRRDLDVLSPAESRELVTVLIGPDRVAGQPDAVAELVERCGRLPLALRIAAAGIATGAGGDVGGYLARLRDTGRLAAFTLPGDPLSSVRMIFDLSYARLTGPARRTFRLLGLVPGLDITAGAAAALADGPPDQVREQLATLADAHLVRVEGDRYSCHDLLRDYAADRARADEPEAARYAAVSRLAGYYLARARAASRLLWQQTVRLPPDHSDDEPPAPFADTAAALAWLNAERANLVATARQVAGSADPRVAWLLADELRPYLYRGGHLTDGLAVAEAGVAAAESAGDRQGLAGARITQASLRFAQSRFHDVVDIAHKVLADCRDLGWADGQGTALSLLGNAYTGLGRLDEAAEQLRHAHDLHLRSGSLSGQALGVLSLGTVLLSRGRLAEAATWLARAAMLNEAAGDVALHAGSLLNLGITHLLRGDLDTAVNRLDDVLARCRPTGDRDTEGAALCALAEVYREAGRRREAIDAAQAALRIACDTGSRELEAGCLRVLTEVGADAGDGRDATTRLRHALELIRPAGDQYAQTEVMASLAQAHQRSAELAPAAAWADQALATAREAGYRLLEGQALTTVAAVHLAAGDPGQAVAQAEAALGIHRETGHRLGEARAQVVLGHARTAAGAADEATAHWRAAYALFQEVGVPEADAVATLLSSERTPADLGS